MQQCRFGSLGFRPSGSRAAEPQPFLPGTSLIASEIQDVDISLEVRAFIDGDALSRDVARYNG
jgi:hypothetical protein